MPSLHFKHLANHCFNSTRSDFIYWICEYRDKQPNVRGRSREIRYEEDIKRLSSINTGIEIKMLNSAAYQRKVTALSVYTVDCNNLTKKLL